MAKWQSWNPHQLNDNSVQNEIQNQIHDDRWNKLKLIEEEKFFVEGIPEIFDKNPDKFRYTMFEQSRESIGCYGTDRIKVLKEAFRTIIV